MATTFTFTFIATRSTPINILSFIPYCPFPQRSNRVPWGRGGGESLGLANLRICPLRIRIVITISQRLLDRLLCAAISGTLQAPVMDFEEGRSWLLSLYTRSRQRISSSPIKKFLARLFILMKNNIRQQNFRLSN